MLEQGGFYFGLVIGFITYRTLRRTASNGISDIASVIGAVGGGAILTLFPAGSEQFNAYAFGLAAGFFLYFGLAVLFGGEAKKDLLGD